MNYIDWGFYLSLTIGGIVACAVVVFIVFAVWEPAITRAMLRWQYGFYAAQAYLASWMDDGMVVANLTSAADDAYRLWCREKINDR